jgi:glucosamine--fructose-6-phosphate aminotransferase (isomerizing)
MLQKICANGEDCGIGKGMPVTAAKSTFAHGARMEYGTTTLREVFNQPAVWHSCLQELDKLDLEQQIGGKDPRSHEWLFVGCGTSYYLAQAAAATFSLLLGVSTRAVPASEVLLFPGLAIPVKQAAVFPVLISRSGHTSEVLQAAEFFKSRNIEFLALTCDGNELAQLTPRVLNLPVAEASTVMTSSFTSMLLALQYIAARLAKQDKFVEALRSLPAALAGLLPIYGPRVEQFAQEPFADVAFLAQGALYPIASETALKVMESSSSYAQFFQTLEFRHGPKSIVSEKVLVGGLLSETGYEEESAVLLEMKELGGRTLAIANRLSPEVRSSADLAIELALPVPELARLAVYVVWGQLFGSYVGLRKGLNPDAPRHLSRVVTITG